MKKMLYRTKNIFLILQTCTLEKKPRSMQINRLKDQQLNRNMDRSVFIKFFGAARFLYLVFGEITNLKVIL